MCAFPASLKMCARCLAPAMRDSFCRIARPRRMRAARPWPWVCRLWSLMRAACPRTCARVSTAGLCPWPMSTCSNPCCTKCSNIPKYCARWARWHVPESPRRSRSVSLCTTPRLFIRRRCRWLEALRPPYNRAMVPILMYHQIGEPAAKGAPYRSLTVHPAAFRRQMNWLRRLGYKGLSMRELLPYVRGEKHGKVVGITFDDGYRNVYRNALPVLRHNGFTATNYFVVQQLGGGNVW